MAIKFQTNVPQTLTFPWGDFLPISGQYGEQFLYTVELAGQRDKLYATPSLHRQLQEAQVGPGCVLTITKVEGEGNRKEWVVAAEAEPEAEPEAGPEPEPEADGRPVEGKRNGKGQSAKAEAKPNGHPVEGAPAAPALPTSGNGNGNGRPSPEGLCFTSLEQLMNACLQASWAAWCALEEGPAFSGEDGARRGHHPLPGVCAQGHRPAASAGAG